MTKPTSVHPPSSEQRISSELLDVMTAIAAGYPCEGREDRYVVVENPAFQEDDGSNCKLVFDTWNLHAHHKFGCGAVREIFAAMLAAIPSPAQESGEPVAWRYRAKDQAEHRAWSYTHRREPKEMDGWEVQPLYATPRPDAPVAALRVQLEEALVEMKHAKTFIQTREKMHPIGVKQFEQVVENIEIRLAALQPGAEASQVTRPQCEGTK